MKIVQEFTLADIARIFRVPEVLLIGLNTRDYLMTLDLELSQGKNCMKTEFKDYVEYGDLAQKTADKIVAFVEQWPNATSGPAHIVLDDYNLENGHLTWCITLAEAALSRSREGLEEEDLDLLDDLNWYADNDEEEILATISFLKDLLLIPEEQR